MTAACPHLKDITDQCSIAQICVSLVCVVCIVCIVCVCVCCVCECMCVVGESTRDSDAKGMDM